MLCLGEERTGNQTTCYTIDEYRHCFYTDGSAMGWEEARQFCAERNSTLPVITDKWIDAAFRRFVVNDSIQLYAHAVWIDAHAHPVREGDPWRWIDGRLSGMLGRFIRTQSARCN